MFVYVEVYVCLCVHGALDREHGDHLVPAAVLASLVLAGVVGVGGHGRKVGNDVLHQEPKARAHRVLSVPQPPARDVGPPSAHGVCQELPAEADTLLGKGFASGAEARASFS